METIRNYQKVENWLHTSGQPTEAQLKNLGQQGIKVVVNLALPTSDHAIPNEAEILGNQEIVDLSIPVDFKNPTEDQLNLFFTFLNQIKGENTLVHCAYNMRVSAFVFLYQVKCLGINIAEAEQKLHQLWKPNGIWEQFINQQLN